MKNILSTVILIFSCHAVFAQKDVPQAVKTAFAQKFSNAKVGKWAKEKDGSFEAEFDIKGKDQSANFSATGEWLETETEIKKSEIPQAVLTAFYAKFGQIKIKEACKIEFPSKPLQYELEYKKGLKTLEAIFDAKGNLLK
jgi:Putative beta-lactamase-inhibitor-like, PepSY-like